MMTHFFNSFDHRTRIGESWPLSPMLKASPSKASSLNSIRGWSGSGTTRSIPILPTLRIGRRPTSLLSGAGARTGRKSVWRTPIDSCRLLDKASNVRLVLTISGNPLLRVEHRDALQDFVAEGGHDRRGLRVRGVLTHRLTARQGYLECGRLGNDRRQHALAIKPAKFF